MAIPLTSVILDTRRALKDGTYPVKLRITHQRQRKYYPTKHNLSVEDFNRAQGEKPRGRYNELRISFQTIEQDAVQVIDTLTSFSFQAFEKKYLDRVERNEVFSTYEQQIKKLKEEGQAGTASCYESAYYSLISYTLKEPLLGRKGVKLDVIKRRKETLQQKKKPLPFSAVTVDFFKRL